MKVADFPANERSRLAELREFEVLDTGAEPSFDDLARLAAAICGTPIALISLVDADRQWFKARVGLDATETPRDLAFCAHAILTPEALFEVRDAFQDLRFADNPLVVSAPHVRFYAGAPIVTESASAVGTLCVIDHTPRELLPNQRIALSALARHVVTLLDLRRALRRHELLRTELEQAKAAADSASRAKTEFLSHMSHEIRTPMNGVLGMARLLCETSLSDQQREMAESILHAGEAQLALLNDILDLSKVEAGKIELERVPFDLRSCLKEAFDVLAPRADERRLGYGIYVDPALPARVVGDPSRLRQIITNLVSNALKFTEKGAVTLRVTALARSDEDLVARFRVSDTGIGIAADAINKLFQPFSQGDTSTARKYGGTGLGLVICKRLTELMEGSVAIESELGQGSTFEFTATFGIEPGAPETRALELPAVRRVLCVVDIEQERSLLVDQLRSLGIAADGAEDAQAAMAVFNASDPAAYSAVLIALSDTLGAGLSLARSIAAPRAALASATFEGRARVPVALVARRDERLKVSDATGALAVEHLSRPLESTLIIDALRRLLERASPSSRAPEAPPAPSAPERPPSSSPASPPPGPRLKVLLTDDNAMAQMLSKRLLERLGCDVDIAEDGRAAVRAFQIACYDIVFMDCQMPVMNGFDATRAIRALPDHGRHVPIIAMTASAMLGDREQCLAAGMDEHISKPIRPEALAKVIARYRSTLTGGARGDQ